MLKKASDLKVGDFVEYGGTSYGVIDNNVGECLFIFNGDDESKVFKSLHLLYDDQEDIDFAKSQLGLELI